MADNRQQIILLHGNSAFTTTSVSDLVKGELVIEHGADATKLHTLANDGSLATFATEADLKDYVQNGDGTFKGVGALETRVESLEGTVGDAETGLVKQVADNAAAIKSNADEIVELQTALGTGGDAENSITNRVQALETTVGNAEGGLVKDVDDNATAIETETNRATSAETRIEGLVTAEEGRAKGEEARIEGLVTAEETRAKGEEARIEKVITDYKTSNDAALEDLDGKVEAAESEIDALQTAVETTLPDAIATAKAEAKTEVKVSGDFLEVNGVADGTDKHMVYTISTKGIAKATDVEELSGKVTTLIGDDAAKSVRTIANEELAAQLLSGEAEADFKTLQELAAWLENHPEDVAAINASILELQKTLTGYSSTATVQAAIKDVADDVETLEAIVNDSETGLVKKVADNAAAITAEKERAVAKEGELNTAITAEKDRAVAKEGELDTAIKANASAIEALDGAVEDLDAAAVKVISYKDAKGTEVKLTPVEGVVDLSGLVIDGGMY